jgi:hypothetical protein
VCGFSLYVPDACPFTPFTLIIPFSVSMSFCVVFASSLGANPVSFNIVKIVMYFFDAWFMIAFTFSVVGISGVISATLYIGLVHCMPIILQ